MIKMPIKYKDFDGNSCEEELLFNLSKTELIEMSAEYPEGLDKYIEKLSKEDNDPSNKIKIYNLYKALVLRSYGVKSLDGKRFIKNDHLIEEFTQTAAYSEFLLKVVSDEEFANKFVKGITPDSE